jgi:DNA repair protein RecN (Recombination protein N)
MLSRLSIRDIVLIDRLDIDFDRGLAALTGETGAGKSILLDAFTLALGARGDAALVRQGSDQGQVSAAFDIPRSHPGYAVLGENDISAEDGVILRRIQFADGRTRAFINDQPVSLQVLRDVGASLVEIHGQHAERALVDAAAHRRLLDAFGGLEVAAKDVAGLWGARRQAQIALAAHREHIAATQRQAEWLRHASDELSQLKPQEGEENSLAERRAVMMAGEKIMGDLSDAHAAVAGSDSPVPALAAAVRRLERRQSQAPNLVAPAIQALDAALNAIEDARTHLESALRAADHDPRELDRNEERLFALRAAGRKYNVPPDSLAQLAQKFSADLASLTSDAARAAVLDREMQAADERYAAAAAALSRKRHSAAAKLASAVNKELPPLKLERAQFSTQVVTDNEAAGPEGIDRVEFWVQTNPGTRPGPLMKVASGGELARFLLALKVVLADRGSAPTLVFDEIDSGVGGAVADAIGARLERLSEGVQVIAVTHAPQVAARANRHFLIVKQARDRGQRVSTLVTPVGAERRREEIARMLAGAEITDEARAAADRLIRAASN